LKSTETGKPVGNTGKPVPKPVNYFFKKSDSTGSLPKTGFRPVFMKTNRFLTDFLIHAG
jgi:hypothetical protein